jgi:hypothetical protein
MPRCECPREEIIRSPIDMRITGQDAPAGYQAWPAAALLHVRRSRSEPARIAARTPSVTDELRSVEDGHHQLGQCHSEIARHALFEHSGRELLRGDWHITDLAAGGSRDLADRVGEGEQPGAGHLVHAAGMAILCQPQQRHPRCLGRR